MGRDDIGPMRRLLDRFRVSALVRGKRAERGGLRPLREAQGVIVSWTALLRFDAPVKESAYHAWR